MYLITYVLITGTYVLLLLYSALIKLVFEPLSCLCPLSSFTSLIRSLPTPGLTFLVPTAPLHPFSWRRQLYCRLPVLLRITWRGEPCHYIRIRAQDQVVFLLELKPPGHLDVLSDRAAHWQIRERILDVTGMCIMFIAVHPFVMLDAEDQLELVSHSVGFSVP